MPSHAEHIAELRVRRTDDGVNPRHETELKTAYGEHPNSLIETFEEFRSSNSAEWERWRNVQVDLLRAADIFHGAEMRSRLIVVESEKAPPAQSMFEKQLAGFGTIAEPGKVRKGAMSEEFEIAAGIRRVDRTDPDPVLVHRWGELLQDARLDVQRRSTDLTSVWKEVQVAATAELFKPDALSWPQIRVEADKTEHNRLTRECADLIKEMDKFSDSLLKWEAAIKTKPLFTPEELEKATGLANPSAIISHVTSLFPRLDGANAPVATYRVVATVQAVSEMWARQAWGRMPQPSYTRMYDRLTEVPGRTPAEPHTEINTQFRDSYTKPGGAWRNLINEFKNDPLKDLRETDNTVKDLRTTDPALYQKFIDLMKYDRGSSSLTPLRRRISDIETYLDTYGRTKRGWPAADVRSAVQIASVAFEVTALKEQLHEYFGKSSPSPAERAIRDKLGAIIDGAVSRLQDEIVKFVS